MTLNEASSRRLTLHWYVLHTKSRHEQVVFDGLHKKKVETFLPKTLKRSIRKDRRVILNIPLFPGYLFLKNILTPEWHLRILKTVGAVKLIGNKEGPVPVPDSVIESLKIMTASQTEAEILIGSRFKKAIQLLSSGGRLPESRVFSRATRVQTVLLLRLTPWANLLLLKWLWMM